MEGKPSVNNILHLKNYMPFFRDGKYVFGSLVIEKLVFFVITIFLAHLTSKNEYGIYITILTVSSILIVLLNLGIDYLLQREIATDSNDSQVIIRVTFTYKLLLLIPCGVILYAYFNVLATNYFVPLLIIITVHWLISLCSLFNSILRGREDYKSIFVSALIAIVVFILAFFTTLVFKQSALSCLLSLLIFAVVLFIILLKKIKRKYGIILFPFMNYSLFKKLLQKSLPFAAGTIFVLVYDRIDIVFIDKLLGYGEVAIYGVAYSLYKVPLILSSIVLLPFFTRLSKKFSNKHHFRIYELKYVAIILGVCSLVLITVFALLGIDFIIILFGLKYSDSKIILLILSFAIPGVFFNNLTGVSLNAIGQEKKQAVGTFVGLLFHLPCCYILLNSFGIIGAAITTVITEFLVFFIQYYFLIKISRSYN